MDSKSEIVGTTYNIVKMHNIPSCIHIILKKNIKRRAILNLWINLKINPFRYLNTRKKKKC